MMNKEKFLRDLSSTNRSTVVDEKDVGTSGN